MIRFQKTRMLLLAGVCLILTVPARAVEVDPYLPDDADYVLSVNVRQVLDSELVKKYGREKMEKALKANQEALRVWESLGFDPMKDIASMTVSGPGNSDPRQALLILRGKFDVDKFHARAEEAANKGEYLKVHPWGTYKIYEVKDVAENPRGLGGEPLFVALVDKQVLVASARKISVQDALDKHAGKNTSTLKKELKAIVEKVDARQSIWLALLSSGLKKSSLASDEKVKDILGKFDSVRGGFSITSDVKLEFVIDARDAAAAADLEKELTQGLEQARGLIDFLKSNRPDFAPAADVLATLVVSMRETTVSLKGEMSAGVIEKAMKPR